MNMSRKVLAFLIGLLMVLLTLEVGLRLIGFFYKKDRVSASLTSMQKQPGEYRILCLGNSYTLGSGAPAGQSYPDQLQRMFNHRNKGAHITVVNGGVGAENSAELLSKLEANIEKIKPDLILLQTGQANSGFYYKYSDYLKREYRNKLFFTKAVFLLNDWLHHSCVYRFVYSLRFSINNKRKTVERDFKKPDSNPCGAVLRKLEYREIPIFKDQQEMEKNINCFKKKIEDNPGSSLNYTYIGQIYLGQRNYKEALKWFMAAVQKDPSDMENHGYQYIRSMRKIPKGEHNAEINEEVDRVVKAFEKADPYNAKKFDILSTDEINRWAASDVKEIVRISRQRGIKIVLQDYPIPQPVTGVLYRIAMELGLPFVEHEKVFQEMMAKGTPREELFVPDFHCTAKGYGVMARNIYNKMLEEKILKFYE